MPCMCRARLWSSCHSCVAQASRTLHAAPRWSRLAGGTCVRVVTTTSRRVSMASVGGSSSCVVTAFPLHGMRWGMLRRRMCTATRQASEQQRLRDRRRRELDMMDATPLPKFHIPAPPPPPTQSAKARNVRPWLGLGLAQLVRCWCAHSDTEGCRTGLCRHSQLRLGLRSRSACSCMHPTAR